MALQSHGVKIPCQGFIASSDLSRMAISSNQLSFLNSRGIEDCCRSWGRRRRAKAIKVAKKGGGVEAVLKAEEEEEEEEERFFSNGNVENFTSIMKFGGSSVASAERMKEIASLVLSFPHERPVVVLSAMGKTTNKLLLVFFISTIFAFAQFCLVIVRGITIMMMELNGCDEGWREGRELWYL